MQKRIFKSALNNVTYVAGKPLTVHEYLALPRDQQNALHALCH